MDTPSQTTATGAGPAGPPPAPQVPPQPTAEPHIIRPTRTEAAAPLAAPAQQPLAYVEPLPAPPVTASPAPSPSASTVAVPVQAVPPTVPVQPPTPMQPPAVTALTPSSDDATPRLMHRPPRRRRIIALAVAVVAVLALIATPILQHVQRERAWQRATAAYEAVDYATAGKQLEGLPLPADAKRLKVYAQTMLANRRFDEALSAYNKLYEIEPSTDTKLIIGNIYSEQKDNVKAATIYQELIDQDAKYVQGYVNLTTLYKLQGKTDEARMVVAKGVASNPGNVTLRQLQVAVLLDQKGTPEYQAAVDGLRAINPTDPILEAIAN